jgi:hypothetical protein
VVLLLLVTVMLVRTAAFRVNESGTGPPPEVTVRAGFVERLAGAIRLPTISFEDADLFDCDEIRLEEDAWEPSSISPVDAAGYRTIERNHPPAGTRRDRHITWYSVPRMHGTSAA